MKYPIYMTIEQAKILDQDHVSTELKAYFTRLLRDGLRSGNGGSAEEVVIELIKQNGLINQANTIIGGKVYILESDGYGDFEPAEYAWHRSEFELILRRMNSAELAEMLCELIKSGWLKRGVVNEALRRDRALFEIDGGSNNPTVMLTVLPEEPADVEGTHPNIGTLSVRMEKALAEKDYPAVLHASASIFETMAKDVIGIPTVQDQTLGAIFDRYKKETNLPEPVLDYIRELYQQRNKTPLAGHGSTKAPPEMTFEEALMLVEVTKAFVRVEYRSLLAQRVSGASVAAKAKGAVVPSSS